MNAVPFGDSLIAITARLSQSLFATPSKGGACFGEFPFHWRINKDEIAANYTFV